MRLYPRVPQQGIVNRDAEFKSGRQQEVMDVTGHKEENVSI